MAQSKTKNEILHEMNKKPYFENFSEFIKPYIKEAMDIYARQEAIAFAHWLEYNEPNGRNTEQLYEAFLKDTA